ncbi:transcription factor [Fusarium heterosporum]|uniref:Transcription factor n=1 Tax=Fusarium heterosporum TaxID=42747 RepID=A0A8H5TYR7_FUSHE|nr:transcription factor [Fusarium heterosporum]
MASIKPTCSLCDISFNDSQEHRKHAKSDSHVQALRKRATVAGLIEQSPHEHDIFRQQSKHTGCSSGESEPEDDAQVEAAPEFDPKKCIICAHSDESFEDNLQHMEVAHCLRVPHKEHLVTDLETLIWYLYFIISTYHECIYCGTRSRTVEGIQQHMVDKGHCRVELTDEMLEFYDLKGRGDYGIGTAVAVDSESLRLPSGKILSNRTASSTKPRRQRTSSDGQSLQAGIGFYGAIDTLATRDRRDVALASLLGRLSAKDKQSLKHLPSSEQRSFLLQRKKELDAVQKKERKMMLRAERRKNKTMRMHFKVRWSWKAQWVKSGRGQRR